MLILTFCLPAWKLPAHRREQREPRTPLVGRALGEEIACYSAAAPRCSQPGDHWYVVGMSCSVTDSSNCWGDSLCWCWESCGGYQWCSCRQKLKQNFGERKEARLFIMCTWGFFRVVAVLQHCVEDCFLLQNSKMLLVQQKYSVQHLFMLVKLMRSSQKSLSRAKIRPRAFGHVS